MTNPQEQTHRPPLGLGPEDLDGHTIEELSDYLDSGRSPYDASIERSAGCCLALEALERLSSLGVELVADDDAADETWVQRIMGGIAADARAGRRIPFTAEQPGGDLGITEGAVRGLIRGAETVVPGALIGRCLLDGDVTDPAAPIRVVIDVSVPYGEPITDLAQRLRTEITDRLAIHTELLIVAVDINVHDITDLPVTDASREDT